MIRLQTLMLSFLLVSSLHAQNTSIDSIIVEYNNVSGGGFQSDVTITEDGLTVYSSADVSGVFKSTDSGLLFQNFNEGLKSPKVASLVITPDNDSILYSATGDKGGSGGLFRSIDAGETWELTGAGNSAQFAGNHSDSDDPVPNGHPRSNGDLLIVDIGTDQGSFTDDIVIAGTYKNGVHIFSQGGEVAESVVLDTGFVRSIAHDPSIPDTVYAAVYFENSDLNGIYEISYVDPANPSSDLVYQTLRPEGITVLSSGRVYAAIGDGGIVKYNGTSWNLKNNDLSIGNENRQWTAVTGYLKGNNDVVYAGLNNLGGNSDGTNYSSVWRTVNGGNTWTALVDANENVKDTIYGQDYEWWFRTTAFPNAGLGRTNSVVSSIDVARGPFPNVVSDDIIYVSGRGGIWKSEDGGDYWNPAVYNMQATANTGVAVNPEDPKQIAIANTDYVVLETGERFEGSDISRDKPSGAESRGYDIIFDTTNDEVILGVGDRDTNFPGGGEVYKKLSSKLGNPSDDDWENLNLQAKTSNNNGRVRAVSYGYHDGDGPTSQTILAAVEGEGVFRYHEGVWEQSGGITINATKRSNFIWPDNGNSGIVYLLDLSKGLFRSEDGGKNWTDIWQDMSFNNKDFFNTGYITADDNNPTTLYLSIQGGSGSPIGTSFKVYRMEGADSGDFGPPDSDDNITDITKHSGNAVIKRPGPIIFGPDGRLWLTQQQNSVNDIFAALYVMDNPTSDLSFADVTTNAYRNLAIQPSGIDVASDGHIYISQNGTGVVKIRYTEFETDLTPIMTMLPSIANGITDILITVKVQELENLASSGDISFVLIKDDRLGIDWDPTANAIGPISVENSNWVYDGSHPSFHIWTSDAIIEGGASTVFGFISSYDPQGTTGTVAFTGTILQNSGGELNGLNNIDVETLFYFSN